MESTKSFLVGMFEDEEQMIHAATELKDNKIFIEDIYTPFPVHGLDGVLDVKRSRLPIITFIFGGIGVLAGMYFQYWTSAVSWPLNIGGKPFNSFVAFIPVGFEITVLFAALSTVLAFLYKAKLFPGKETDVIDPRASDYLFLVNVECTSAAVDAELVKTIFKFHGAKEIKAVGVIQ